MIEEAEKPPKRAERLPGPADYDPDLMDRIVGGVIPQTVRVKEEQPDRRRPLDVKDDLVLPRVQAAQILPEPKTFSLLPPEHPVVGPGLYDPSFSQVER